MNKALNLFVFLFCFQLFLKADSTAMSRLNVQVFGGPALVFDGDGTLTGSAGIRLHTDLNNSFFMRLQFQEFLTAKYSNNELLFSTVTFTPAKFVDYQQSTHYALAGLHLGYYWYGWADQSSNAYFSMGANIQRVNYRLNVDEYKRDDYEAFPNSGSEKFIYYSWSLSMGHQSLLSSHIGIFEEFQLDLALNASKTSKEYNNYQLPKGQFVSLNFGFRFFLFSQKELLD